ncbi:MAG: hypothetical protein VKJ02_09645 [Snowella sp.]|nr:hypothetical protein [Snowella sp.]
MNTRFKLTLIQSLNPRKVNRHKGFVLPMAMMVGLVIIVAGTAMVIRAQGSKSEVVSQADKTKSLAAAETGLTRVQNMMNNVKFIALYPMSSWTSAMTLSADNSSVTINDTDLNNLVNSVAASTACSSSGTDVTNKANNIKAQLATIRLAANGTLTDIDPNNPGKGKFRLVDYTYSGTAGSMPGNTAQTGGFVIEGQSGNSGNAGKSRIAVEVPIKGSSPVVITDTAPGLWIKKGGINTTGAGSNSWEASGTPLDPNGNEFQANVYFSNCDGVLSDSYVAAVQSERINSPATTATKTSLPFPSLPSAPPSSATNVTAATTLTGSGLTDIDDVYHYTLTKSNSSIFVTVSPPSGKQIYVYNDLGNITSDTTLPRTGDVQSSDGKYRYKVGNISGNTDVTINSSSDPDTQSGANQGVSLYVTGDITLNGNAGMVHSCSSLSTDADKIACANRFQIYGYKSNGEICLKGNSDTYGYILAPDTNLGKTGNGLFTGSIIARSWGKDNNCGSNNAIAVRQVGTWADLPPEFQPATFSPQVGNPKTYKQQAVQ